MPSMYNRLRAALPDATFLPPATQRQITRAEKKLGVKFPDWLRDLYRNCNGIRPQKVPPCLYLLSLGSTKCIEQSVVGWNEFLRKLWLENLPVDECQANADRDKLDPRHLLIIGCDSSINWAIRPESGPQIICYDVRNDDREVIAEDLVQACVQVEQQQLEVVENLFRGRELYRSDSTASPPSCDVDQLFDIIISIYRRRSVAPGTYAGTGWWLHRAISQRPGEHGELFSIPFGSDEARIVSRDGNLPFVMRLKVWPFKKEFSCIVRALDAALMRILAARNALWLPYLDGKRPRPNKSVLQRIWRDAGVADAELEHMADVLCARDDKRRSEPNPSGE